MLVVMHQAATAAQIDAVLAHLAQLGLRPERLPGSTRVAIGVLGNKGYVDQAALSRMPGVLELIHVTKPYKKVSREFQPTDTLVRIGTATCGSDVPLFIAGPCSVESADQVLRTARFLATQGVHVLRGGIFKPRSSPYSFQGMGLSGLALLQQARNEIGLPICVEITRCEDVPLFAEQVDLIQVGARNMQNYDLLQRLGRTRTPILLKRSPAATVEEFLLAAEYLLEGGNDQVILCERGIRSFERSTRYTLDLNSVALIRTLTHLPIIVDPSHAAGRHDLVPPLARAALAVGAQGLIVETHPEPERALSDAEQQLNFEQFAALQHSLRALYTPALAAL